MSMLRPEVGSWYQTPEGDYLEVVARDSDEGTVEIQHYDGAIEEFDDDSWRELKLRSAEPPEDWAGSLDVSQDDYGVDLDRPAGGRRENPLDLLDERKQNLE